MIRRQTILKAWPDALRSLDIPGNKEKHSGKVRDFYIFKNHRIIVTTDRQSAFDVNLGIIPFKGAVLNSLAGFWFAQTKHIIDNHVLDIPDQNVTIARNCTPIPVEMIVRGYMSGVTTTSIWSSYRKGERLIYGLTFPDGLTKNQALDKPVITPTTHPAAGSNLHDERLTREEIINQGIVEKKLYEQMEHISLALFDFGSLLCLRHGLRLVDTKYEFGLCDGKLTLIDEVHTPDSSRFWVDKTYQSRFKKGLEPENFDKEFLRLWYANHGYLGNGQPPDMPEELMIDLSKRYVTVYEKITGTPFRVFKYPIDRRILAHLKPWLN